GKRYLLAGSCGQQVDIGAGGVQERLAGDALQVSLLLPDLALGVHPLEDGFLQIEFAIELESGKESAETGTGDGTVLVGDTALMAPVRWSHTEGRQPAQARNVLPGIGFLNAGTGRGNLGILPFRQPQHAIQIDGQGSGSRLRQALDLVLRASGWL